MKNIFTFINSIADRYKAYVDTNGVLMIFDEAICNWEQAGIWKSINGYWRDDLTFVEG